MKDIHEKCRKWEEEQLAAAGKDFDEFYKQPQREQRPSDDMIIDEEVECTPVILAFPEPYIIGAPISIKTVFEQEREGVVITAQIMTTEVAKSLPNGFKNFAISNQAFLST